MQIDLENSFALKVRSIIENYARQASTPELTAVCDARRLTYVLLEMPKGQNSQGKIFAIVRVIAGWVIVDEDQTAVPLVDLLVQDGIEREKIVLAYAGEAIPNLNLLLAPLLKREVHRYAAYAPDAIIYPVLDDERQIFAIIDVPNNRKTDKDGVYVINMAHMAGDKIVIDEERVFDKPLYEALIWNAGIPRSQIVLAYAGKIVPVRIGKIIERGFMMDKRRLGRTNHMSSLVIVGAAAFSNSSQEEVSSVLDLALSRGVNHIDVAPSYGHAESVVGPWLESRRDQFFLGCKTNIRDAEASWAELNQSLKLLRTDKFELYQLHAVTSMDDLERAMRPGGAIETLKRAKAEGLTQFLGITGHGMDSPAVQYAALQQFDFDTVMFPIHPRLYADAKYRADAEKLLDLCQQRDLGVQIIKSITRGAWGENTKNYHTWYQPYDHQDEINEGVRFALSQPGVAAVPSAGDTRLFPMVLNAADAFTPMSAEEQAALIQDSAALELMF